MKRWKERGGGEGTTPFSTQQFARDPFIPSRTGKRKGGKKDLSLGGGRGGGKGFSLGRVGTSRHGRRKTFFAVQKRKGRKDGPTIPSPRAKGEGREGEKRQFHLLKEKKKGGRAPSKRIRGKTKKKEFSGKPEGGGGGEGDGSSLNGGASRRILYLYQKGRKKKKKKLFGGGGKKREERGPPILHLQENFSFSV